MIHVNFGWLNDYSGSKFAPFTLADKVLLNTEDNTTESFYDFVKNQNVILSESILHNGNQINQLQKRFYGLVEPNKDNLITEGINREVAAQARLLVTGPDTPLSRGTNQNPVFFYNGIPQPCVINAVTSTQEIIGANMYITDWDKQGNAIYNTGDIFDKQICDSSTCLDASITGKANYADFAYSSATSIFSTVASKSQEAEIARSLNFNIQFGTLSNGKTDYTNSDIVGYIPTQGQSKEKDNGTLYADGIQLKEILSKEVTVGGAHTGSKIIVDIPVLTVDTKGRIIEVDSEPYTPQLSIASLITAATNQTVSRFPVLTAVGSNDGGWSFYSPGDNESSGVYLEYDSSNQYCILMGAAWNDYAEFRNQVESIEPGYCVASNDNGKVYKTTEKFQACDGIVSDTFGFSIGKTETCQTPLAVAGRVLAYCYGNRNDYHAGDTVCAGPEGKVYKMTREEIKEYPDRIIGIVSEIPNYEEWNNKQINNRIWIKIK